MRLADCLNSADIHALQSIAVHNGLICQKNSKHSLMQAILSYYADRKRIRDTYEDCSSLGRATMHPLILSGMDQTGLEELHALASRTVQLADEREITTLLQRRESLRLVKTKSGGKHRAKTSTRKPRIPVDPEVMMNEAVSAIIEELMDLGLLFKSSTIRTREVWVIPSDLRHRFREYIAAGFRDRVELYGHTPIAYRDDGFSVVRDLTSFLQFIDRQEVRLTQDGTIYKRQQQQLMELFEVEEETAPKGWRFGYGRRFHDYPDRFALVYDFCYSRGYIAENADGLLSLGDIEEWLSQDDAARLKSLYTYWRNTYRKPIPRLAMALAVIVHTLGHDWVTVDSLCALVTNYVESYYYDSSEQVVQQRILAMLGHLGLMARGQTEGGTLVVRLTEIGEKLLLHHESVDETKPVVSKETFMVQPNFDVLLPASAATSLGWELSKIAERKQSDGMYVYRLTRESIHRALASGWTPESIMSFLTSHSAYALPGNVETTLTGWCKQYGNVVIDRRVVVSCSRAESLQEIALSLKSAEMVQIIGDRHALVNERAVPEVLAALRDLGESPELNL